LSLMDMEVDEKWDEKYMPHLTSYTSSDNADNANADGNLGGRPTVQNPTNENTLISQGNGSNDQPKPSTE
jgi:negative regulator of replication initiation